VPGKRCLARELAQHDAPARFASCYTNLRTYLPDYDRVLVGIDAIRAYLHDVLRIRRPNGQPVTRRIVLRWHRQHAFPLVRGGWHARPDLLTPSLCSTHAVTSWVLAQFSTAVPRALFSVSYPQSSRPDGMAPKQSNQSRIGAVIVRDAA